MTTEILDGSGETQFQDQTDKFGPCSIQIQDLHATTYNHESNIIYYESMRFVVYSSKCFLRSSKIISSLSSRSLQNKIYCLKTLEQNVFRK